MKELILFLLFAPALLFAQSPITYDQVIRLDSISKDDLFNRGNHWLVDVFKDPNRVIQLKDKEGGQIIGKGNFPYMQTKKSWSAWVNTEGVVNFTIKLYFKEGRYRYVITDFTHDADWSFGAVTDAPDCGCKFPFANKKWKGLIWNDLKDQIDVKVKDIATSLISSMEKKAEIDDGW